jgi:hypothetical protein
MILQGFETREDTDIPVRALVASVNGILHRKKNIVLPREITEWPAYSLLDGPIVVFGILRGTGSLIAKCIHLKQDFYYFDHAYLFGNKHEASNIYGEKVYRLTKNWFHINKVETLDGNDKKRIAKVKKEINLKPWSKSGEYILVCPPSIYIRHYFNIQKWLENTIKILKNYSDRKIKIRSKDTSVSLDEDINNAWAVVSSQSTVAIEALINGKPSFCDKISMALPLSLTDFSKIEEPIYPDIREQYIDTLLANQFTLKEIESGFAWTKVNLSKN